MTVAASAGGTVPASRWPAPRQVPTTYPGPAPDHHYLLLGDEVMPLAVGDGDGDDGPEVRAAGGHPVDDVLAQVGAAPLAERVPVLAYGANRSPHSLAMKLSHHGYEVEGRQVAVPVLAGSVGGFDVVVAGISSQGFVYADLAPSPGTRVEVLLSLLDPGQLAAIHDSEGVGRGLYECARVEGFAVAGTATTLDVLAYAGCRPVFLSPESGTPLAFSAIGASGRRFPAYEQLGLLAHVLRSTGTGDEVAGLLGLDGDDDRATARELARLLNGQWWYMHNTGDMPMQLATRAEALVRAALAGHGAEQSTAERLAEAGAVLGPEEAYAAGPALRLGWGSA